MTPPTSVEVRAPSRLHFGLFSFNDPTSPLQFGGVGAMVDTPGVHLRAARSDAWTATGPHSARASRFAQAVAGRLGVAERACHLEVLSAPRQHVGLGLGTQLGMSVAAALVALAGGDHGSAADLSHASGRGLRSAIGAHGFVSGGLLVDGGHRAPDTLGALAQRVQMPTAWRFVLVVPPAEEGLANAAEQQAFASLPAPTAAVTERLHRLATTELAPAVDAADFNWFANTLYEYGRSAGECFAAVQGGPFASPAIAERVELIRSLGGVGCGQSSWGPTVFAAMPNSDSANLLITQLRGEPATRDCQLIAAAPCNTGATVTPHYSRP